MRLAGIEWETTGEKLTDGYETVRGVDDEGNRYEGSALVRSYDFQIMEIEDIEKL